jgi:tetratricopeptide (TPR) repeat protein
MNRIKTGVWAICILTGAWGAAAAGTEGAADNPSTGPSAAADLEQQELLMQGRRELDAGRRREAIGYYDKVIAHFRAAHDGADVLVYCAHTPVETLLYAAMGATQKRSTTVLGPTWADAYLMKGYALVELGQLTEAREAVEASVALAPQNAQYLAELGYVYQATSEWAKSLDAYQRSAEGAQATSAPEEKQADLTRALRGQGFALTELGRLDEAEALYRKCLEIDSKDAKASNELDYIRAIRKKKQAAAK